MGDAEVYREYQAKLLIIQNYTQLSIGWDECPLPLMKQFTQQGKSCSFVLEKASNKEATGPSVSTTSAAEKFNLFGVSINDPCWKVLPVALKKYNIAADWRDYAIYLTYDDEERCLGLEEKPLVIFRRLEEKGKKPIFMLRKHASPAEGHTVRVKGKATGSRLSSSLPGGVL